MPKALHDQLARAARRRGLTGARYRAYVYGTMRRVEKRQAVAKRRQAKRVR